MGSPSVETIPRIDQVHTPYRPRSTEVDLRVDAEKREASSMETEAAGV